MICRCPRAARWPKLIKSASHRATIRVIRRAAWAAIFWLTMEMEQTGDRSLFRVRASPDSTKTHLGTTLRRVIHRVEDIHKWRTKIKNRMEQMEHRRYQTSNSKREQWCRNRRVFRNRPVPWSQTIFEIAALNILVQKIKGRRRSKCLLQPTIWQTRSSMIFMDRSKFWRITIPSRRDRLVT